MPKEGLLRELRALTHVEATQTHAPQRKVEVSQPSSRKVICFPFTRRKDNTGTDTEGWGWLSATSCFSRKWELSQGRSVPSPFWPCSFLWQLLSACGSCWFDSALSPLWAVTGDVCWVHSSYCFNILVWFGCGNTHKKYHWHKWNCVKVTLSTRHVGCALKLFLGLGAHLPKDQLLTPQRAEAYYQEERFLL